MGSPLIRKSMISLLQSFPPSKEIDEIPYCGLSFSKEVDDFLPAGFSQVMKLMIGHWVRALSTQASAYQMLPSACVAHVGCYLKHMRCRGADFLVKYYTWWHLPSKTHSKIRKIKELLYLAWEVFNFLAPDWLWPSPSKEIVIFLLWSVLQSPVRKLMVSCLWILL